MADVHSQIAQQNMDTGRSPSWAEQVDSEELLEGFMERVNRVSGADVSGQARRDGSASTIPMREKVPMESEMTPEETKTHKKK